MNKTQNIDVGIVGGGVMGITAAIKCASLGLRVKIKYDGNPCATDASAAFYLPVLVGTDPRIASIATDSLHEFARLARDTSTGVRPIRLWVAYSTFETADSESLWRSLVPTRSLRKHELPEGCVVGYEASVFRMEMTQYMSYLRRYAANLGVKFEIGHVQSLAEIGTPIIVNCTGVYARELTNDLKIEPIRGQVVLVETPRELANRDDRPFDVLIIEGPARLDYIVFRDHDMLLGGTAERGNWDWAVNSTQTTSIISNCGKIIQSLGQAPLIGAKVGLRPYRPQIRLEVERVWNGAPIVHCVGHGGSGVTLSWGSANIVQGMVADLIKTMKKESRQLSFAA